MISSLCSSILLISKKTLERICKEMIQNNRLKKKPTLNSAFNITENHNESDKDSNDIQMDRKKTKTFFVICRQNFDVATLITHEDYNNRTSQNDIARKIKGIF
jgi:hypothetical protein